MQRMVEYFEEKGRGNTDRTLELARQRAQEAGIRTVVFASTRSYTAGRALDVCPDLNLIAVGIERDRFAADEAERFERTGKLIFAREVGYSYPADMQTAFFFSLFTFTVFGVALLWHRIRIGRLQDKVERKKMELMS